MKIDTVQLAIEEKNQLTITNLQLTIESKQGPTGHRPMAHPVVFRYLSYFTTFAEHAIHRLRRCLAFGRAWTCLFLSVQLDGQSVSE